MQVRKKGTRIGRHRGCGCVPMRRVELRYWTAQYICLELQYRNSKKDPVTLLACLLTGQQRPAGSGRGRAGWGTLRVVPMPQKQKERNLRGGTTGNAWEGIRQRRCVEEKENKSQEVGDVGRSKKEPVRTYMPAGLLSLQSGFVRSFVFEVLLCGECTSDTRRVGVHCALQAPGARGPVDWGMDVRNVVRVAWTERRGEGRETQGRGRMKMANEWRVRRACRIN